MRGFVNKYTITWYWVSKSQPSREQSTIAGLIAVWCGHVTRDTWHVCVMCHAAETGETMLGPALCLWKLQELKVKVWWWDQQIWLGISFSSGSTRPQQTCRPCLMILYSEKASLSSKKLLWMGVKTSDLMLSLHKQEALRNLATKPPLSASIVQHCQILSNISCMPGQNKI